MYLKSTLNQVGFGICTAIISFTALVVLLLSNNSLDLEPGMSSTLFSKAVCYVLPGEHIFGEQLTDSTLQT